MRLYKVLIRGKEFTTRSLRKLQNEIGFENIYVIGMFEVSADRYNQIKSYGVMVNSADDYINNMKRG